MNTQEEIKAQMLESSKEEDCECWVTVEMEHDWVSTNTHSGRLIGTFRNVPADEQIY